MATISEEDLAKYRREGDPQVMPRGRPRAGEEPNVLMAHMTISIDPRDREALRKICERDGVPMSSIFQRLVKQILAEPDNARFLEEYARIAKRRRLRGVPPGRSREAEGGPRLRWKLGMVRARAGD